MKKTAMKELMKLLDEYAVAQYNQGRVDQARDTGLSDDTTDYNACDIRKAINKMLGQQIKAAMLVVMSELNKVNTAIIKSSCGRVF